MAVAADEKDFITFSAQGTDPFDNQPGRGPLNLARVLEGCNNCHHVGFERGIDTVLRPARTATGKVLKPHT